MAPKSASGEPWTILVEQNPESFQVLCFPQNYKLIMVTMGLSVRIRGRKKPGQYQLFLYLPPLLLSLVLTFLGLLWVPIHTFFCFGNIVRIWRYHCHSMNFAGGIFVSCSKGNHGWSQSRRGWGLNFESQTLF